MGWHAALHAERCQMADEEQEKKYRIAITGVRSTLSGEPG